jgi:hypothetical protein
MNLVSAYQDLSHRDRIVDLREDIRQLEIALAAAQRSKASGALRDPGPLQDDDTAAVADDPRELASSEEHGEHTDDTASASSEAVIEPFDLSDFLGPAPVGPTKADNPAAAASPLPSCYEPDETYMTRGVRALRLARAALDGGTVPDVHGGDLDAAMETELAALLSSHRKGTTVVPSQGIWR